MCVLERGRGHETVITDSILHLKKDPAVLPSRAHCSDDEEDADMPAQSAASDCVQSHISTQTHSYHTGPCVNNLKKIQDHMFELNSSGKLW